MAEDSKVEKKANPAKSFLSGGFGGICTVISGHPLDTIKVRLQTMPRPAAGEQPMYKGTFDCAAKTIKNEGFLGLYKGMSAPIVGVAPIFALCFAGYALGKRVQQTEGNTKLGYRQIFVAGSFSGLLSTIITAPGERIKCLLQIQQASGAERKYNGMLDCAVKLFKQGGFRSIYKGSCATLLRDLPANGVYFLAYESIQEGFKKQTGTDKVSLAATLFAGGSAGIAYWLVGMPADVLKSRLQTDMPANGTYFVTYEAVHEWIMHSEKAKGNEFFASILAGGIAGMSYWILGMPADVLKSRLQTAPEGTYRHGIRDVFSELMKTDGPLALYRGVQPIMLRAFPANAACFFGVEFINWVLSIVAPDF